VKGYSVNLTETCAEENPLNLITDVQVNTASTADCDFLQPSIDATREIVAQKIETVNTDGAFHSVDNQGYCKEKDIDLILGAIQGKPPRYDVSLNEKNELIVTDLQTNTIIPSSKIKPRKEGDLAKWKIKNEAGKTRYFTQKEIDTCLLRKQIANRTQAELNVRNNASTTLSNHVEASIFQLGYHYSNDKSRYRGLSKHKMWANVRCLWVNFVRIMKFIIIRAQKATKMTVFTRYMINWSQIIFLIGAVRTLCLISTKKESNVRIRKKYFL
jgi:hypothetical protein